MSAISSNSGKIEEMDSAVLRFAGDSGDGMQLVGDLFTKTSAISGENVATLPDFPAEIRAPSDTVSGVSAFQVCLGGIEIHTPGDQVDVLLAMNPAALKVNLKWVKKNGTVIVNEDAFQPRSLEKAGYSSTPLQGSELESYKVLKVSMTKLTKSALEGSPLGLKQIDRCKNFFALGLIYRLFNQSKEYTARWLQKKFQNQQDLLAANLKALETGWSFGETSGLFPSTYSIRRKQRTRRPGTYRNISGNTAAAMGLLAASNRSGLPLFLGSYPITPATDILHELIKHKQRATVFQAEDEIAAIGSALGAAYGGALAATTTSGPGFSLKSEFINLAVMVELPLLIVDVQRAGPSTGLPTKTEQADLFQALWGRHGESPVVVLAARSPAECFDVMLEAARIALHYMTPVIVLSDGYLGNGSEVWRVPSMEEIPEIKVAYRKDAEGFFPYARNPETLARPWAIPGTPHLEHRIGGLEKEDKTGAVSHSPENHEKMVQLRAEKVARVAREIPPLKLHGAPNAELLVVGWGSTTGVIRQVVERMSERGVPVASVHLRHLNPLPSDLGPILKRFRKVLVAENNLGQLWYRLRAEYLLDSERLNKVQGLPFKAEEIETKIKSVLGV
ncbi:MAG: 2-oxoacid:acceptor oxidoreductase subunit alpha [Deltaproteobacteria bacterium]|nr:2-oxoacid:acceptor oxidoreductase subunit alpha [Deltaproteobacteria bacterium]